jgi:hypothetical protein
MEKGRKEDTLSERERPWVGMSAVYRGREGVREDVEMQICSGKAHAHRQITQIKRALFI